MIEFFVHGTPVPQGSKRVFHGNVVEMGGARLKSWRLDCAQACHERMGSKLRLEGPVYVEARFFVKRPKRHYRTGQNSHLLRDDAPVAPVSSPDIDKLTRALLDAITGIAFRDDGQVSRLSIYKLWADPIGPGVECRVTRIT